MIRRVTIRNFKRFESETFELDDTVVLAGPNNSGKSTLLQALSTWSLAVDRWKASKGQSSSAKKRRGAPLTRKDFTALPLREFDLLWHERSTALTKGELGEHQKLGEPRMIQIEVEGDSASDGRWALTMELRYQGPEQIYVRPTPEDATIPPEVDRVSVVHCPPFSGIGSEERRFDRGAQNLEIGRGKPGDILRNLLLEVSANESDWRQMVEVVRDIFSVELLRPEYDSALTPFIVCEYRPLASSARRRASGTRLDIASAGSGLLQVLLLLAYFYARPAATLLLDEPDAHLHVILQRQVYDTLRRVAAQRNCQLVLATHSEVILDGTAPTRVISFLGHPHPLVSAKQRDQLHEAMGRLTTLDLLLAEQQHGVLYCEGQSDFKILQAWAEVAEHPARQFFKEPFFHSNEGRSPREAKGHLFALRAGKPTIKGLLLLDGDNRNLPDREVIGEGLEVLRWPRYEIENYLLVPDAIVRFLASGKRDLFTEALGDRAMTFLKSQLPPAAIEHPLQDNVTLATVRASKDLLPQLFAELGLRMEKPDFFLIAAAMQRNELHPDVIRALDVIAALGVPVVPARGEEA